MTKREWRAFKLTELFDFVKGDQNNMASIKPGLIPLVSAKKEDNGYKGFAQQSKKLYQGNSLTLNNDGDGGAGISYYQPADYLLDSHVTALYPKENLNKFTLLYISRCITAQRDKFGHGYSINNQRLRVFKLMLPINSKGKPDYNFMENYMKEKEKEHLKEYEKYTSTRINKLKQQLNINVEWKEFVIGDIFKIYSTSSSIDKNKLTGKTGLIPYITRTDKNNGYDLIIGEQPKYVTDKGNVITIGLDTQTVFYQNTKFYTGQNIQILEFDEINQYNAQFIIALLKMQMTKFNWGGNGATLTRLKKTKILLPKNEQGKPDYPFMENYMKVLEIEKLKLYLEYKKTKD